jgi:hypothetical protein
MKQDIQDFVSQILHNDQQITSISKYPKYCFMYAKARFQT